VSTVAPDEVNSFVGVPETEVSSLAHDPPDVGTQRGKGMKRLLLAVVIVGAASALLHAENWPQFRGLRAGVATDDPALPDTWGSDRNGSDQNIVWKVDLPGVGWSSPVVWGDHVFVTTAINAKGESLLKAADGVEFGPGRLIARALGGTMGPDQWTPTDAHRWMLYDVDFTTGAIRWERQIQQLIPPHSRHTKNSYATETPVTDGERVYAYFSSLGLFVFDMNGKPVWSKPMDALKSSMGGAASPIIHKDRVYIVNDNEVQSFIAAYDARTGTQVWRVDRDEKSNFATPFVWEHPQRVEIVTKGSKRIRSYGADGKVLWELSGGLTGFDVPTPFANGGLLYLASGYPLDAVRSVYVVRPGASGDISLKPNETSNSHIVWSNPTLGTYATSALVYGDYYYTLFDRGLLSCHDAKTGKEIYRRQRVTMDATAFTASPWAYNGKIFAISEDGDTYVMQAGPEFKLLGKNSLNEITLATPAVANGSVIIRTASKLYRVARKL
jgi:outer membrane protein assembly factor BamB